MATDTDNFNRTFATLNGETSSGGNTWTRNGAYSGSIVSANVNTEAAGSGLVDNAFHYCGAVPATADYKVGLKLSNTQGTNVSMIVSGRQSTSADTMDNNFWHGGNSRWEFRERSAGSSSTLATDSTNTPVGSTPILEENFVGSNCTVTTGGVTLYGGAVAVGISAAGRGGLGSGDSLTSRGDDFYTSETAASGAGRLIGGTLVNGSLIGSLA